MAWMTFTSARRVIATATLPLVVAATVAGVAGANPGASEVPTPAGIVRQADPVAGGLRLEAATDPEAQIPDPRANGMAAGAAAGALGSAMFGAGTCAVLIPLAGSVLASGCAMNGAIQGAILGALAGLLVGAVAPELVPQILP